MKSAFSTDEDLTSVALRAEAVRRTKEIVSGAADAASALGAAREYLRMFPEVTHVALVDGAVSVKTRGTEYLFTPRP